MTAACQRWRKNCPCKPGSISIHAPIKSARRLAGNLLRLPYSSSCLPASYSAIFAWPFVNFRLRRVPLIVFAFNAATLKLERQLLRRMSEHAGLRYIAETFFFSSNRRPYAYRAITRQTNLSFNRDNRASCIVVTSTATMVKQRS